MFKDYKYSVISITHITSFFRFLLLSTSNVRMSEGTFCHVKVHMKVGYKGVYILAHQTEIATLFAWVIKLHLTQVFSPRLKKNTQNLEINQILGVVVQEKESNMVFCSRWKFPTLGMTVLSGTSAEPRFRSARSSLGLETSIYNRTPYKILILHQHVILVIHDSRVHCFREKQVCSQRAHDVRMTSYQRRCDMTSHRR